MQTAHVPDYVINKDQDFIKLNNHFLVCIFFLSPQSYQERERERMKWVKEYTICSYSFGYVISGDAELFSHTSVQFQFSEG